MKRTYEDEIRRRNLATIRKVARQKREEERNDNDDTEALINSVLLSDVGLFENNSEDVEFSPVIDWPIEEDDGDEIRPEDGTRWNRPKLEE